MLNRRVNKQLGKIRFRMTVVWFGLGGGFHFLKASPMGQRCHPMLTWVMFSIIRPLVVPRKQRQSHAGMLSRVW